MIDAVFETLNRPLALSVLSGLLDGEEMPVPSTSATGGDDGTQLGLRVETMAAMQDIAGGDRASRPSNQ